MSNWWYVAIAYTVVWGALAMYALLLARRVTQAREVARRLRDASIEERHVESASQSAVAPQGSE